MHNYTQLTLNQTSILTKYMQLIIIAQFLMHNYTVTKKCNSKLYEL